MHAKVEVGDLAAVQEELAPAARLVVGVARMLVARDVGVDEPRFAAPDLGEGLLEADLAGPDALDLAACGRRRATLRRAGSRRRTPGG
jgi:hypothetical protein